MKKQDQIQKIFGKYLAKTIDEKELAELFQFFDLQGDQAQLDEMLQSYFFSDLPEGMNRDVDSEALSDRAWSKIQLRISPEKRPVTIWTSWIWKAAAAAIIIISLSIPYLIRDTESYLQSGTAVTDNDIQPGSDRATLTSSSGIVYQLNGSKHEIIVDKSSIHYKDGEVLMPQDSSEHITMTTPRGGQYRVVLSDGTQVWLNAGSSLSYSMIFSGHERRVELSGEAYFVVAHDTKKPFIVQTANQEVKVLGTSFNINAYSNESRTVTTLLTGSVQLSSRKGAEKAYLIPGQQSIMSNRDFDVQQVEVSLFTAWKDGEFRFQATPLTDVMRQIERWYDLDVDFSNIPEDIKIHASMQRNKKLSTVLHALEKITDLKFKVEGRSVRLMH